MNKVFHYIFVALAIAGVFLIIGSIGTSDYMDEIGQMYPVTTLIKRICIGVILILPVFTEKLYSRKC